MRKSVHLVGHSHVCVSRCTDHRMQSLSISHYRHDVFEVISLNYIACRNIKLALSNVA